MKFKLLKVLVATLTVIATATSAKSQNIGELKDNIKQVNSAPNMSLRLQGYTLALDYFKDLSIRMVQADKISYAEGLEATLLLEKEKDTVVDACFGTTAIDKCTEIMNSSISGYSEVFSRELQK